LVSVVYHTKRRERDTKQNLQNNNKIPGNFNINKISITIKCPEISAFFDVGEIGVILGPPHLPQKIRLTAYIHGIEN
jgi:hypothetical protein